MDFILTWKSHIICFAISLLITLMLYPYINYIFSSFFLSSLIIYPTAYFIFNFFLYILIFMVPITIIHEAIHGFFHVIYGGKIKFGFKGIYAYTLEISGRPISRNQFITVLLSPVVLISFISLLIPSWLGGLILILNLLGSSGDLYMTIHLLRIPKDRKIVDCTYGLKII